MRFKLGFQLGFVGFSVVDIDARVWVCYSLGRCFWVRKIISGRTIFLPDN